VGWHCLPDRPKSHPKISKGPIPSWSEGPESGFLLPFVSIFNIANLELYQGYIQPFITISIFILSYKISRFYKFKENDSFIFAFGFTFSSVVLNVISVAWSWWFAQSIAVLLLLLLIYMYLLHRNYVYLGIVSGCAFLTRSSLVFVGLFIVIQLFFDKKISLQNKISSFLRYILPICIAISIYFMYNYLRFGDIFEQGYYSQILLTEGLEKAREYGLLSLTHLPGNLYYFLLSGPLPVFKDSSSHVLTAPYFIANPWGMSMFLTSPWFIYIFLVNHKDRLSYSILLTIIIVSLPIFLYYGIGYKQFGYRYSLDFLPLMYWLLLKNTSKLKKEIPFFLEILLIVPAFTNLYFLFTIFL
jgi:hypothetical protein